MVFYRPFTYRLIWNAISHLALVSECETQILSKVYLLLSQLVCKLRTFIYYFLSIKLVFKNILILALNFIIFIAKQLVICIRLALQDGANGMWGKQFSGYVVTLLVIFYLQIAGHLPSVLEMQSEPGLQIEKCGGSFCCVKYMHYRWVDPYNTMEINFHSLKNFSPQ